MRKITSCVLLFISILSFVDSYAIEGSWKLTDVQDTRLSNTSSIRIDIKDFIFRNTTIRWTLAQFGCQNLKVIIDVQGKNIFVDVATIFIENSKNKNCSLE